jgi:hypothetical protein
MFCSTSIAEVGFAVQGLDTVHNLQGENCLQVNLSTDGSFLGFVQLTGANCVQQNLSSDGEASGGQVNLLGAWGTQVNLSSNGSINTQIGKWVFTGSDILQPWTVWKDEI